MEQRAFAWTALPPLPIRGLGTECVESLEYYVLRLSWQTGWSVHQLSALIEAEETRDRPPLPPSCYLLGARREAQILALERLTGNSDLRHGTLWVLKHVLNTRGLYGDGGSHRRWCPRCYKLWDMAESWEPLIWSIPYVRQCPIHRCDLVGECPSCGETQLRSTCLEKRHQCRKCGSSLCGEGSATERPKFYEWVDGQILSLVKFCGTSGQVPFPTETLAQFAKGLGDSARERRVFRKVRKCLGLQAGEPLVRRLSLRALINLSALLGTSALDLLQCPESAMDGTLLDIWTGFHWLCDPFAEKDDPVRAARWLLTKLLARCKSWYLPPMQIVTKDIQVSAARLKEFDPEVYQDYMDAYGHQCSPSGRIQRERAFAAARRHIKSSNPHMCTHQRLWWLPKEVERQANVSLDHAFFGCSGAIVYSRLLAHALMHARGAVAAKEDIRWIESAREVHA